MIFVVFCCNPKKKLPWNKNKKMARKVFLDVGAHVGETLAEVLRPKYAFDLVVAFEPSAHCIIEPHPKLKVERMGLSDRTHGAQLFAPGTLGSSIFDDNPDLENAHVEDIKLIKASSWFTDNLHASDTVYMKLNCEGSEADILSDLLDSGQLARCSRVMVDFTMTKIPSLANRESELRVRLARFAKQRNMAIYTAQEAMVGVTHQHRIAHWLRLCEPVLQWTLPSLADFRWISATYGSPERSVDVLDALLSNIGKQRGCVQVSNALCGTDPHIGVGKSLTIEGELDGVRKNITAVESGWLYVTRDHTLSLSFMVQCSNGASTLSRALTTLEGLLQYGVRYEVVVVLHRCTDQSQAIADAYARSAPVPVRVLLYGLEVSRAGLETYVTDDDHPCSLISYCNWCLAQARAPFVWKWDSDFELNDAVAREVAQLIATCDGRPIAVRIPAKSREGVDAVPEPWFSNACTHYAKSSFWEVPVYCQGVQLVTLKSWFFHHDAPALDTKPHSLTPSWFAHAAEGRAYVFRRRFQAIEEAFGTLPFDMASSCSLKLEHGVQERLRALTMSEVDALWAKVTVVVTACNRPHLLRQTMQSFVKMNTAPISECIIIEDSGLQGINEFVKDMCPFPVTLVYNARNLGQLSSMDRAYELVRTEFLMHMEDDMEFVKPGFIEKSVPLLFTDPKVFCVWLRSGDEGLYHSVEPFDFGGYRRLVRDWKCGSETWCGFTFNSSLRLTRTARMHGPYAQIGWGEHDCNRKFAESGHYALILNDQYVKHIGWGDHCAQNWK